MMTPRFQKILVPVDGSKASRAALRLALELARLHGAQIMLLFVIDASTLHEISRLSGQERPCLLEDLEKTGDAILTAFAKEALQQGIVAQTELRQGMPEEVIIEVAGEKGLDVIVMGKIGGKGHRRSMLGSVTERVLEAADLPVVVVTPPPGD
jgi:nucleotide-binding universal stress UspA family protein